MVLESLLSGTGGTVVFEFYLPFLLTFTLFFGLMDRVNPFGPNQKKLHVIISLIAAFYILIFSPFAGQISTFFATFFAETSLVIVTLLVGMMVVALFISSGGLNLLGAAGFGGGIGLSAEDLLIIGMVVITVAAIWFMGRSSED